MSSFLDRHGWSMMQPIAGDVSLRRYSRVEKAGKTAVLMDCSREQADRPGMQEFVAIAAWLREVGLRAPEIYEADEVEKFLLIEDLGDVSFSKAIKQGVPKEQLYRLGADVLSFLREQECPLVLPSYHETRINHLHRDVIGWWACQINKDLTDEGLTDRYLEIWAEIERSLPAVGQGFIHMDYHLENLMWLPDGEGLARCGLLDFQDAAIGPVPYDLANLLEDARVSVDPQIKSGILGGQSDDFMMWYRVLALQFHCRVIGLFTRLCVRDNRPEYLIHVPRLAGYIAGALEIPFLAPLKTFFSDLGVDFNVTKDLNAREIEAVLRV